MIFLNFLKFQWLFSVRKLWSFCKRSISLENFVFSFQRDSLTSVSIALKFYVSSVHSSIIFPYSRSLIRVPVVIGDYQASLN